MSVTPLPGVETLVAGDSIPTTEDEMWDAVSDAVGDASGIFFDGCHKIYIAMNDEQAWLLESYGYQREDPLFDTLHEWFIESCMLRFVQACDGTATDTRFVDLVPQGIENEFEEKSDDDDSK